MAFLQDPSFWVAVAFFIFIGALAKPAGRLITGSLDARADKIRGDLEEAEKLREEAQDLLAAYQRKQRDAVQEAEAMIAQAETEAERHLAQGRERLEAVLERREKLAMDRIAQAEVQAMDTVRARTVDIALNATRGFLAERLSAKQAEALIDAAVKDLPGKLH